MTSRVVSFFYSLRIRSYLDSKRKVRHVERYIQRCSIGDWFVIFQMSRNMNRRHRQHIT